MLVMAALSGVMLPLINKERGFSLICIAVTLVYALGAVLLLKGSRSGKERLEPLWMGAVLAVLALTVLSRVSLLPHVSSDYNSCLSLWLADIRSMPGFTALGANIGDYNTPYFYLLFALGKLLPRSAELYAIKLISILFDYVLAYFVMRLVMQKTVRRSMAIGSFIGALLIPSILMNSAMWGQCDSIFTAFSLGALYYGLRGKSRLSWAFFALALSFKLQTVFLLPMLLVLLFTERVRLKDFWVFPVVFVALLVPAMIAGRGFIDCIAIYLRQTNTYTELSMLAPSIFSWIPPSSLSHIPVAGAGILVAGTITLLLLMYLLRRRKRLDNEAMIEAAFLFALIIPFFLPRMHERYFYAADAMAVVYLFYRPERWYISLLACLSSSLCHASALFGATFVVPLWLLSFFILGAICLLLKDFVPRIESIHKEYLS